MNKIPTIFDRDWDGDRAVVPRWAPEFAALVRSLDEDDLVAESAVATEKLDGTNIRITVRAGTCVRVEKRRNPSKQQKRDGISEPWYVDASADDPADRFIFEAVANAVLLDAPDGEWPAEAIGPKIQGNPLALDHHEVVLFSLGRAPILRDVPTDFDELREWLPSQRSALNPDVPIEGVVWHWPDGRMAKIKTADFKLAGLR